MSEEFSTALSLLVIGMITVFIVLLLVVITGRLLISLVNSFDLGEDENSSYKISPSKIAAITTAVDIFTAGEGRISKIEKENQ